MNADHLSQRLKKVAEYVEPQARIADIGSDHAYLPIYLVKNEKIPFAIAGEVVDGPFQNAKAEIEKEKLSSQIKARLGSGLEVIEKKDAIDTLTICGMGGKLITEILEAGGLEQRFNQMPRLILQPNVAESQLRQWLLDNQYVIIDETIVEENKKFYEIIVAEPTQETTQWDEDELLFGRYIEKNAPAIFKRKWQAVKAREENIVASLKKTSHPESQEKLQQFTKRLECIKLRLED